MDKTTVLTPDSAEGTNPLDYFLHCPHCGSTHFAPVNPKAKLCEECGFEYYANPLSACACFVTDMRDNILVAIRGKEPARGSYDLPGGFVDMDETAEEAMARELWEETGIDATGGMRGGIHKPLRYLFSLPNLYLYSGMTLHTLDLFYHMEVVSLLPYIDRAGDDVAQLEVIPAGALDTSRFGLRSIRRAVEMIGAGHYF